MLINRPKYGKNRGTVIHRAAVACLLAVIVVLNVVVGTPTADAASADAATSSATLSLTGTDARTGVTATAGGPAVAAQSGDTIDWTMSYTNTGSDPVNVALSDPLTGGQTFVAGSLHASSNLTASFDSTSAVVSASGDLPAGASASSPAFPLTTLSSPTTPGGDGFTVEGLGGNIYTVFHHADDNLGSVYCATLAAAAPCAGWPGLTAIASPVSGAALLPVSTSNPGLARWTSGSQNGSFISGSDLYWPVGLLSANADGKFPVGMQCLDLVRLVSCGIVELDEVPTAPKAANPPGKVEIPGMNGSGAPAGDGNYYYLDDAGNLVCFDPTTAVSCGTHPVTAGAATATAAQTGTFGSYVYGSYYNPADQKDYLTCYDVTTAAVCAAAFPVATGAAPPSIGMAGGLTQNAVEVMPDLTPTGAVAGACDVFHNVCLAPDGGALSNPWTATIYGGANTGSPLSTGVVEGTRYYTIAAQSLVECFDFSLRTPGASVPQCAGWPTAMNTPGDARGYTVRALANIPGCLAADGDAGQILLVDAATGGACAVSAVQSVSATPDDLDCAGKPAAATWGSVTLTGLTGAEYMAAMLTVFDQNGTQVESVPIPSGVNGAPPTVSLDTLSTSTYPSLTVSVSLTGVIDSDAVQSASIELTWVGNQAQVCFQTTLPTGPCPITTSLAVSNTASAVTTPTVGTASDTDAGPVVFAVTAVPGSCPPVTTPPVTTPPVTTPPVTTPPVTTPPVTTPPVTTPTRPGPGTPTAHLAQTGSDTRGLAAAAGLSLLLGSLLVAIGLRRRDER
jgi:uncharacterized repeat protein (TIGR01451 family)